MKVIINKKEKSSKNGGNHKGSCLEFDLGCCWWSMRGWSMNMFTTQGSNHNNYMYDALYWIGHFINNKLYFFMFI